MIQEKSPVEPIEMPTAENESASTDLTELRCQISSTDDKLLKLFAERMRIARSIARAKAGTDKPVYDPDREDELLDRVSLKFSGEDSRRAQNLMSTLMRMSRGAQYDLIRSTDELYDLGYVINHAADHLPATASAVYQGPLSSYSSQACRMLYPDAQISSARTFAEACRRVVDGIADVAVLPLENTTAGTVDDVYDLLIEYHLSIHQSISLPIRHCLLVAPGTKLEDVREVVSHPQALAQCSEAILHYGWNVQESLNTAYAAAQVRDNAGKGVAAIASAEAASANNLRILLPDICNMPHNQTRFIAVGRQLIITPDADRLSLVLRLPHRSGSLASTLAMFADRGINLSKIQSRPDPYQPWSYLFYLDADCPAADSQAMSALYQLSKEMPYLKLLGWYHEIEGLSFEKQEVSEND
ncbi:MAG: prephenate dehydratase domain-containing protein [Eubacteriales bacterium]|nr:prephenate dehydratase domain-containing protein [Eubacteriales bacterium]MDD3196873.1 prephenate dehydratase domain-containing protein [Eubacteriales bacterium]MDD3502778.1 prephenate dehydratase domain-containing protein [Eubacteriales bacterium]